MVSHTVPYGTDMTVARQPVGPFPIFFQFLTSCGRNLQDLSKTEFCKFDPRSSFLPGGSHINPTHCHDPCDPDRDPDPNSIF